MMTEMMEETLGNEFIAPVMWKQYPLLGSYEKLVRNNLGINR
jgi:hypothetical protein